MHRLTPLLQPPPNLLPPLNLPLLHELLPFVSSNSTKRKAKLGCTHPGHNTPKPPQQPLLRKQEREYKPMHADTLLNDLHDILRRGGLEVGRVVRGDHAAFDEARAGVGVVECEIEGRAADVVPESVLNAVSLLVDSGNRWADVHVNRTFLLQDLFGIGGLVIEDNVCTKCLDIRDLLVRPSRRNNLHPRQLRNLHHNRPNSASCRSHEGRLSLSSLSMPQFPHLKK